MRCSAAVLFLSLLISFQSNGQILVENNSDPAELVSNLSFTSGLAIFNITFSGDTSQFGLFNAENSNIPLDFGVVLGSGDVSNVIGPNDSESSTMGGGNLGVGDSDLAMLSPFSVNDAAILEFDFVALEDTTLTIEFVFGSEEYNEYVCSTVNDGIGIFLSGPNLDGPFSNGAINLATVPGTNSPVSINSINSGQAGNYGNATQCDAVDSLWTSNSIYFYNNEIIPCPGETQLDGFTVVLSNSATILSGNVYHLKIAIGDGGDAAYDSALFIKGNAVMGCTAVDGLNYQPLATIDDGSCTFAPVYCADLQAVNFGYEGTCCFSESAYDSTELMGTWMLDPFGASIMVGPEPGSGEWYTGFAMDSQLDERWTFFSNGALIFETGGGVLDPLNGYFESPLSFPLLGFTLNEGEGFFGQGTLSISNPIGGTCAFMGTWDSGPHYDVAELEGDTLRLVSRITDISTCEPDDANVGYFTFTFIRTEFNSSMTSICSWGCTDVDAPNYEPTAIFDNGNCITSGCTYLGASNFNDEAQMDDGSCQFEGCMDMSACNFNPLANVDNGTCESCEQEEACTSDLDGNGSVTVADLLLLLGAFGTDCGG